MPTRLCRSSRIVESRLAGRVGDKIPVVFRNGNDEEVSLDVPLARPRGHKIGLGHLPAQYVHLESRRLEGNILYVSLNAFLDPARILGEFERALLSQPTPAGVVLDLRGNPGGLGGMAMGMGNRLVQKPDQRLGTMTLRNGTVHFVLNPQAETYSGPLAILIDGCSASTSEILAGGLKDIARARLFGTRTAGAALPSIICSRMRM